MLHQMKKNVKVMAIWQDAIIRLYIDLLLYYKKGKIEKSKDYYMKSKSYLSNSNEKREIDNPVLYFEYL